MKRSYLLIAFTLFIFMPFAALAKKDLSKIIELDGVAEVGALYREMGKKLSNVDYNIRYNEFERIGTIELDLKFIPFKKNYLAFDVEYEFGQPSIKVDKLFIGFKILKEHLIKVGYMKKPFGVEELTGKADKPFIKHSAFHSYIKSFNFYGEDLMIQYKLKGKLKEKNNVLASGTFGGDASKHFYGVLNGSIMFKPGKLSTSLMYVYNEKHFKEYHNIMCSLAFEQEHKRISTDIEVIGGIDPNATSLEDILSNGRIVYFIGSRLLQAYHFPLKIKIISEIEPLWETNLVVTDYRLGKKIWQFKPGMNLFLGSKKITRIMINTDLRYSTNAPKHDKFSRYQIGYLGQFKFVW